MVRDSCRSQYADYILADFAKRRENLEAEFEEFSSDSTFHARTLFATRKELLERLWHAEKKLRSAAEG